MNDCDVKTMYIIYQTSLNAVIFIVFVTLLLNDHSPNNEKASIISISGEFRWVKLILETPGKE